MIIEQGPQPRVIGEIDRPSAPLLIHEDAIYIHRGQQYQVDQLDWDEKKAYVTPGRRRLLHRRPPRGRPEGAGEVRDARRRPAASATTAKSRSRYLATIFKKIKLHTHENVGWGKIAIPEESLHTTAYWLTLGEAAARAWRASEMQAALGHGASAAQPRAHLPHVRPARHAGRRPGALALHRLPTVFLYDNHPGGVGMARRLFEIHTHLMHAALEVVRSCDCRAGCPGCVGPSIGEHGTNKRAATLLLHRLCEPDTVPAERLEAAQTL